MGATVDSNHLLKCSPCEYVDWYQQIQAIIPRLQKVTTPRRGMLNFLLENLSEHNTFLNVLWTFDSRCNKFMDQLPPVLCLIFVSCVDGVESQRRRHLGNIVFLCELFKVAAFATRYFICSRVGEVVEEEMSANAHFLEMKQHVRLAERSKALDLSSSMRKRSRVRIPHLTIF